MMWAPVMMLKRPEMRSAGRKTLSEEETEAATVSVFSSISDFSFLTDNIEEE